MPHKIKLSIASFNEFGAALEAQGLKFGENINTILIEKGTEIERPIDYRQATMRKDAGLIASRAFNNGSDFIAFMDQIYEYILNGKSSTIKDWK